MSDETADLRAEVHLLHAKLHEGTRLNEDGTYTVVWTAEELAQARKRATEMMAWFNDEEQAPPLTVAAWQAAIHQCAEDRGWHDPDGYQPTFGDSCMMMVSELSEAYEEFRNNHEVTEVYYNLDKPTKPEGVPTELADVVIRILNYFGRLGVDFESIMAEKHAYNMTREHKHGGKRV